MDLKLMMINSIVDLAWKKEVVTFCHQVGLLQFRVVRWVLNIDIETLTKKVKGLAENELRWNHKVEYNNYKQNFSELLLKDWKVFEGDKWVSLAFPEKKRGKKAPKVTIEEHPTIHLKEEKSFVDVKIPGVTHDNPQNDLFNTLHIMPKPKVVLSKKAQKKNSTLPSVVKKPSVELLKEDKKEASPPPRKSLPENLPQASEILKNPALVLSTENKNEISLPPPHDRLPENLPEALEVMMKPSLVSLTGEKTESTPPPERPIFPSNLSLPSIALPSHDEIPEDLPVLSELNIKLEPALIPKDNVLQVTTQPEPSLIEPSQEGLLSSTTNMIRNLFSFNLFGNNLNMPNGEEKKLQEAWHDQLIKKLSALDQYYSTLSECNNIINIAILQNLKSFKREVEDSIKEISEIEAKAGFSPSFYKMCKESLDRYNRMLIEIETIVLFTAHLSKGDDFKFSDVEYKSISGRFNELLQTEENYQQVLKLLVDFGHYLFKEGLKNTPLSKNLMDYQNLKIYFDDLEKMLKSSHALTEDINNFGLENPKHVVKIFLSKNFFDLFKNIKSWDESFNIIKKYKISENSFKVFQSSYIQTHELENNSFINNNFFEMNMCAPLQRITRYPLYFQDILKAIQPSRSDSSSAIAYKLVNNYIANIKTVMDSF